MQKYSGNSLWIYKNKHPDKDSIGPTSDWRAVKDDKAKAEWVK